MDIKEFAQEFIENVKMSVEMTGADYFLYGNLDGKKIIANVSSNQNIESEKDCFIKLDIDRIHIFDKINERLICD